MALAQRSVLPVIINAKRGNCADGTVSRIVYTDWWRWPLGVDVRGENLFILPPTRNQSINALNSLFQSWVPTLCERLGQDVCRGTEGIPTVYNGMFVTATRWTCKSVPSTDCSAQSGCGRRELPLSEHLCPLSEIARLPYRGFVTRTVIGSHARKRLSS